jgi:hypothetical protein
MCPVLTHPLTITAGAELFAIRSELSYVRKGPDRRRRQWRTHSNHQVRQGPNRRRRQWRTHGNHQVRQGPNRRRRQR